MIAIYIPAKHYQLMEDNTYVINDYGLDAITFLPKSQIGEETMEQITQMVMHPAIFGSKIRIMPDCHRGSGCCVGFTYELRDKIVPNFVGSDIGCGIMTYPIGKDIMKHSLTEIEKTIRDSSRMGNGPENIWQVPIADEKDLEQIFKDSTEQAIIFCNNYAHKFKVDISYYIPDYSLDWLKQKCQQVGADYETDILKNLGTLGGGNHYIEVNKDSQNDNCYLTIHCGSRGFGTKICNYHQIKIDMKNKKKKLDRHIEQELAKEVKKNDSFQIADKIKNKNEIRQKQKIKKKITDHPDYLENEEAYHYYMDMIFCQKYACLNRRVLLRSILAGLKLDYNLTDIIESVHNYIDFSDLIVRKGAISAYKDQQCIVSLNMRDGILLCEGKSNPDWNNSCAHGSGRILSRKKASDTFTMKQFHEEMKNVYSTTIIKETLDESPMAYKDTDFIKSLLGDTVTIKKHLYPIINLKGYDK